MILYEYPFNERIRTYLRLERLFDRFSELSARSSALDHHFALITLFEILDVASRSDLKSEIMRDLDRQKQQLNAFRGNPAVSEAALDQTVQQADQCFQQLEKMNGKIGQILTENEWLMSIRSRASIPGGTCEFDLPAYYAWQHQAAPLRQQSLQQWVDGLQAVADSVKLLLSLLRGTGHAQRMTALHGQFQHNLPQGKTYQLLRLSMADDCTLIPEISANRLIVSVRMMQQDAHGHLSVAVADSDFQLTLCG